MARVIIPGVSFMTISNAGDGSAYASFFSSRETAERYLSDDLERFRDDVHDLSHGIEVDPLGYWDEEFVARVKSIYDNRASNVTLIAEHFECGENVVRAWARGEDLPHPKLRDQVRDFIASRCL